MNQSLVALDALQEVDTAIARTERAYRALDSGEAERKLLLEVKSAHEKALSALRETEASRLDAELQLNTVEEKKRDHEGKLYSGKISNPKELAAMQHEIEALGRQRAKLDERILELMEEDERQRTAVTELAARLERIQSQYDAKVQACAAETRKLKARMAKLAALRTERVAGIPASLLKRYDALRVSKHGVGIARIVEGRCGACNTSLPRNTVSQVRDSEALVTCDSCGRLLCIHSDPPQ